MADRPLSVLIVDDEEPVLKFVERVLTRAGFATTIAANAVDALAAAEKGSPGNGKRFDLLVTDVNMPRMTGDELARRMRQIDPAIKVLYLTGYSDQLFKEKSTLWQDEAFLDKPCSMKGLLQAVSLLAFGRIA
jgi:two-component system, cell cycle sensor histidine kinase and response regulator CckA